jgi:hypothetical protein
LTKLSLAIFLKVHFPKIYFELSTLKANVSASPLQKLLFQTRNKKLKHSFPCDGDLANGVNRKYKVIASRIYDVIEYIVNIYV